MAAIDVAGYVADLKDHSVDHGFHVHDERHFVETYSLRQVWEVDLHPEEGCGGPLDLHLALDVDPRVLLSFEDAVVLLTEEEEPPDEFHFPLTFTWALPPLPSGPGPAAVGHRPGRGRGHRPPARGLGHRLVRQRHRRLRDGGSASWHGTRYPWPGYSAAKSSSATSSTAPWPLVASSSSQPTVGSAEVRRPLRRVAVRWSRSVRMAVGAMLLLSACGQQSGEDLARQACVHVNLSVHYFEALRPNPTSAADGPTASAPRPTPSCAPPFPWRRRPLRPTDP